MRSESCDVEKRYRDVALRKRFGRNVPQAKTRFPPNGAMRNELPDKLVYLQATPQTTHQMANAAMKRPTARPEAAYSEEFDQKVKAKEFNLKAGIGKARGLCLVIPSHATILISCRARGRPRLVRMPHLLLCSYVSHAKHRTQAARATYPEPVPNPNPNTGRHGQLSW